MGEVVKGQNGLFARKRFDAGQLLCYYSGVLWNTTEDEILPAGFSNSDL